MTTLEQIKSLNERVDALRNYLDIEGKTIQLEEEELKTQVPDFGKTKTRRVANEKSQKLKSIG